MRFDNVHKGAIINGEAIMICCAFAKMSRKVMKEVVQKMEIG